MQIRQWAAAALVVLAAAGLAACGSGSKPTGVASLSGSNADASGSTTTTLPHGNPTQLVDEWASCMRKHGVPNLADPTIDTNGTIHITLPQSTNSGASPAGGVNVKQGLGGGGPCGAYLTAAAQALGGPAATQKPDPAKLLAYSQCMRAHGIPDFPDPSGGGFSIQIRNGAGSDLNPNNPTFKAASKTCAAKAGVPAFGTGPHKGGIVVNGGGGPDLGPSGGPKSGSGAAAG